MVKLATIETLAALEQEMAKAGRTAEQGALQEARRALSRPHHGFITTGQAAERLGVSIPTIRRTIERGGLVGRPVGSGRRWLVSEESVEAVLRTRVVFDEFDREGVPTDEEIQELYRRPRRSSATPRAAAS